MITNLLWGLLAVGGVALFGAGWMGGATVTRSTYRHIKAQNRDLTVDVLLSADKVTAAENARHTAEQRADRAEAAWHALLSGRDQSEAGS